VIRCLLLLRLVRNESPIRSGRNILLDAGDQTFGRMSRAEFDLATAAYFSKDWHNSGTLPSRRSRSHPFLRRVKRSDKRARRWRRERLPAIGHLTSSQSRVAPRSPIFDRRRRSLAARPVRFFRSWSRLARPGVNGT